MQDRQPGFLSLAAKTAVCHALTYFIMGALAYNLLHYADAANKPDSDMRSTASAWILFGPALQVVRGVLFASVFYPLRSLLFNRRNGWLLMSWILIGVGILGTFGAPSGSLEGFIYTTIPVANQFRGYLEIVPQALLLSALLCYWVNHPEKKWLNWALTIPFLIGIALPPLSMLAPKK
jgi:hypothetical protein